MFLTTRRSILRSLLSFPAALAASHLASSGELQPGGTMGYLNLHLRGPFSYVFFASLDRVLIIAPDSLNHHVPEMYSQNAEAPVLKGTDYQLSGIAAAAQKPQWTNVNVNRLTVPAHRLGLDAPGKIDKDKARYFSIVVPAPDFIVPWHPIKVTVTGNDSPLSGLSMLPVGYTFIYKTQDLSNASVIGASQPWLPLLAIYPGENFADISIEMSSSLDIDCKHKSAVATFTDECALFNGVPNVAALDLALNYGPVDPACGTLKAFCKEQDPNTLHALGHTGSDCKALLLEVTDANSNVGF